MALNRFQSQDGHGKRLLWLGVVFGIAFIVTLDNLPAWVLAPLTAITLLIALAQYRQWRLLGFAINGDYLTLRSGLVGRNYVVAPLYKAQRVTLAQTSLMRRRNIARRLEFASRTVTLPCHPRFGRMRS